MKFLHLALIGVLTMIFLCAFDQARPPGPTGEIVTVPAQGPKIEWETYPVGGLILANPAIEDSLGHIQMVVLPPGSMLGIPHLIEESPTGPNDRTHS